MYNIVCQRKEVILLSFQISSSLLDACVLAILAENDAYGYVLTQSMKRVIDISDSTLYPVLRRLQKNGLLSTYDVPYQGRNRRYYKISDSGRKTLSEYKNEWEIYKQKVDRALSGGIDSNERNDDKNE